MPLKNLGKYRQLAQDTGLHCIPRTSEEGGLDLERKMDAITKYQKPYTKKILTEMARANPQNAFTLFSYVVAQKNEQNIKDQLLEV